MSGQPLYTCSLIELVVVVCTVLIWRPHHVFIECGVSQIRTLTSPDNVDCIISCFWKNMFCHFFIDIVDTVNSEWWWECAVHLNRDYYLCPNFSVPIRGITQITYPPYLCSSKSFIYTCMQQHWKKTTTGCRLQLWKETTSTNTQKQNCIHEFLVVVVVVHYHRGSSNCKMLAIRLVYNSKKVNLSCFHSCLICFTFALYRWNVMFSLPAELYVNFLYQGGSFWWGWGKLIQLALIEVFIARVRRTSGGILETVNITM